MGAHKRTTSRRTYNFTNAARILAVALFLTAVAIVGVGMAPAAAAEDTSTDEFSTETTASSTFFFDDEADFVVEAEDATVESGSETTVDVEIEPTDRSGFGYFVPRNEKINWFVLTVEYDDEALDFEGVAGSQVGDVEVTEDEPGRLTIENGYDFGDFFLDPDEAPATLAELEFSASSGSDAEVAVTPSEDSKVGWGPSFLKDLPAFQHDVDYESGTVDVIGSGDGDDGEDGDDGDGGQQQSTLSATNTGGFISFGTDSEDAARSDGIEFPAEGIQIDAKINDDGTWESTNVEFPTVTTSGIEAEVTAVDGLEGEIDQEGNFMTAEGTLEVNVLGDTFQFDIATTTEDSGALSGSADLSADGGTATLIDNEYIVDDSTGNLLVDSQLGLPIEEPGQNWLELPLDISIEQADDGGDEPETGTLDVSVTDQNGDAIEGASVSGDGIDATTDANGQISVDVEPGTYDLTVEAEGESASLTAEVQAGETTSENVQIELPPETGTLDVSVSDQDGNALEGATVTVDGQTAQTDASGVATVSDLEVGEYDVTVEAEGESTTTQATVEADSTTTADVTVELPPETGTLEVSLSDQNDNALDGTVTVGDQSAETDNGVATLELAPGEYEATIEASGETITRTVTVEADATTTESITIEVQSIDVESFRATSTGGFISFDETNLDDAIAEGLAFPDGSGDSDPIVIEAEVNDDGTWESTKVDFPLLNTAEDGSGFDAQATAPNGLSGEFDPASGVATAEGTLQIELLLNGETFSFDVAMTTGASNGEATEDGLEGEFDVNEDGGTLTFVDNEYTVPTTTNSPILNQRLGLPIEEPGLAWLELPLDVDFDSNQQPQTGALEVSATDQDGNAIEGATVTVDGQTAQTDASGVATVSGLETGTYDVTVEAEGESATTQVTVEADSTVSASVSLELPPETGALEVSATDQDGNAIESATVTVDGQTAQTDASGVATFSGLETGTYDVTVDAEGKTTTGSATVEADSTTELSLSLDLVESFSFTATSTGGFISFDETTIDDARANGISFPDGSGDKSPIVIEGEAEGGQWESTKVDFPTLTTSSGFDAEATAPNGLQGEIDRENNVMTAEGTLNVTLALTGDSFEFDIKLVTDLSDGAASEDGLQGSADFANDQATLVDNEYTVPEKSGNPLLDDQLGLPLEDPGLAWLELPFEFEFSDQ